MAEPQTSRFWIAAQQSGLLDVQGLMSCWDAIPPDKRDATEHLDRRLARQAVQQSLLTLWQAQQLLAGRTSGFRVDRYLLLELIGQGGMGRVYLARDTRLNRLVALKILAPERMNNSRAVERFKREARVGAQLQHENLVRIYDFGQANGRFFLVMEYIEGKTIGALITAQGPVPTSTAARLAWQIALGLEHAHRKGLIHRDVNPYNVLVTHEGIAKLADLGLAIDLADDERVTREGATVGTFDYVAPEQARHSHSADIRSDIYSLGCTLYHMVAGQVPFPSPSLPEKLFAHQAMEPASLIELVPGIDPSFVQVVQRMMRKAPDERYATPLQVAQALERFIDEPSRNSDDDITPVPLIVEEQTEPQVVSPPVLLESQSGSQLPVAERRAQENPAFGSPTPTPSPELDGGRVAVAPPGLLTPVAESEVTSGIENNLLVVDVGPEPSLKDSLSRPKSWFGSEKPKRPESSPDLSSRLQAPLVKLKQHIRGHRGGPWSWWLALTAVILALLTLGSLLMSRSGTNETSNQGRNPGTRSKDQTKPGPGRSHPFIASDSSSQQTAGKTDSDAPAIMVLSSDGAERPVEDIFKAMEAAIGADGWVVLQNRKRLQLPVRENPISLSSKGRLRIRGAEGLKPVLGLELKGHKPFMVVGPSMDLTMEGVAIEVKYVDPPPANASSIPIIQSGGSTQVRHCAFKVENGTHAGNTRALVQDGGNLTVENCWFKGFQTALEVHAIGHSTTQVKQTMIVPATGPSTSSSAGWGFRIEFLGGNSRGSSRRLILDHCTVVGSGLLQLAGFSLQSPLEVEARECAVQTTSLVGWETVPGETPGDSMPLKWTGKGNLLDVTGAAWIVPVGKGTLATGLQSVGRDRWCKLNQEDTPLAGSIPFLNKNPTASESSTPSDYQIDSTVAGSVGANSREVGPSPAWSNRAAP